MTAIHHRAVPEKPTLDGIDGKHARAWESSGVYRFRRERATTRDAVYSIDTPPPTASGALHIGHVYSYTHTDIAARYQRMRGREVFYPMGWDDNGLPTERRAQNYFHVRCDPTLPYDPATLERLGIGAGGAGGPLPPAGRERRDRPPLPVSRRAFVEACELLTKQDEQAFEALWRRVGLSVDWSMTYSTISPAAQRVAQHAFLRQLADGEVYHAEAPTAWDVDFQTAVAQAEQEDREVAGAYHRLIFTTSTGARLHVDTTRPELLPACVALVAHPDDQRFQHLFGAAARTPLFGVEVPIRAHRLADPDKGSGIAMVCTYGDQTDVTWQRELGLPIRAIIGRDGRLVAPEAGVDLAAWGAAPDGAELYRRLAGRTAAQARREIVSLLAARGLMAGEPRPIRHTVRFYEKGERPLEIVTSRQWFIRTLPHRDALIKAGREIAWQPDHMRRRYEDWVDGLTGDWLISRQRFFGTPFPVWYPLDGEGRPDFDAPITPEASALPVDPHNQPAPGRAEADRGQPGGFIGDPDVMDTWATSSLTPQLLGGWLDDEELWRLVYPMDLRPQAHDIIRTWLFATVVRALPLTGRVPWSHAAISGFVTDPDRKKMSKSFANAATPMEPLERHGGDAVRYWAAGGRPGADATCDPNRMRVGRRLATKLLNVARFVLSLPAPEAARVTEPLDVAMLARLGQVAAEATEALDGLNHTRALERIEEFFWSFCDDYVELVKSRAYDTGAGSASARAALEQALDTQLRLFAPFVPFVTEEVWSWWRSGSIHRAAWPSPGTPSPEMRSPAMGASAIKRQEYGGMAHDSEVYRSAVALVGALRRAKAALGVSMRAEVGELRIAADAPGLAHLPLLERDLRAAVHAARIATAPAT